MIRGPKLRVVGDRIIIAAITDTVFLVGRKAQWTSLMNVGLMKGQTEQSSGCVPLHWGQCRRRHRFCSKKKLV